MLIPYKTKDKQIKLVKADSCSGLYTKGVSYLIFYYKKKEVLKILESKALPGVREQHQRLFGKPWRDKLKDLKSINLYERDIHELGGLPKDTERVWSIYELASDGYWVIEQSSGATFHMINHKEKHVKADSFPEALRKLFPGKKISVDYPTVKTVEVQ